MRGFWTWAFMILLVLPWMFRAYPSLSVLAVLIAISAWVVVVIGLLHENEKLNKLKLPDFVMDILDKYTNKDSLSRMVEAARNSELIDADTVAQSIKEKVIGQDHVADQLAVTIRRRLAMEERDKPVGVFCFAGPPGVGKTELGKQLAEIMDRGFLFFDMSTCNSPEGASTLFGSPKGYAGSDSYGQLTSGLRDQPAAVVLLDEFEKASTDVMRRFLTAWNDGFVTEASDGRKIPTNRAIFVLTANAGAERIGELSKKIPDRDELIKASKTVLKEEGFPPEVLSRIDRVFAFNPLEGLDLARVAAVHILSLVRKYGLTVAEGGVDPEILFDAMQRAELLQEAGGVREIIRAIEEKISDGLIEARANGATDVALRFNDADQLIVEKVQ